MKYKDRVKKDFNLNIDSQKEFEKFNNKIELVDDSVSLMHDFTKFKKSMVLTCSVLGALLVGSIGVNIAGIIREKYEREAVLLMKHSLDAANEYFKISSNDIISQIELTYFLGRDNVFNVYEMNGSYFGQVYNKNKIDGCSLYYSFDTFREKILLQSNNTIWLFGDISDKDVSITFYRNDIIYDTFSFKI